jgi:integrase
VPKLTDAFIRSLTPPAKGSKTYYDTGQPGYGARITATGVVTFVLRYWNREGAQPTYTIGRFGPWTALAGRNEAKRLRREIDLGGDPSAERQATRDAPTMHDLIERFRAEHLPKKRPVTIKQYKRALAEIDGELGSKKVAAVQFRDCEKLHRKITNRGKAYQANRTNAVLSRMFTLAIKWQMRPDNPCRGLERNEEQPRERYLTPAEMERLTGVLASYRVRSSADLFILLLLTGARIGETLAATWDQFNFDARTWQKPSAHTKQKRSHLVPISAPALEVLQRICNSQDGSETHVFPERTRRATIAGDWKEICRAAKIADLHIHDLRHSNASLLVNAGFSLPMIGRMLGHTQAATTQRYAHLQIDTLTKAADTVGEIVSGRAKLAVVRGGKT